MTRTLTEPPRVTIHLEAPDVFGSRRIAVAQALRHTSYEVLPLRSAEESIVSAVPQTVPLSVTMTAGKGVQPTIELTERLTAQGYTVTPHLAARLFRDRVHLADTVNRLRGAGVCSAFVIAGDAADPLGPFTDALGLLEELQTAGHPFSTDRDRRLSRGTCTPGRRSGRCMRCNGNQRTQRTSPPRCASTRPP